MLDENLDQIRVAMVGRKHELLIVSTRVYQQKCSSIIPEYRPCRL